ncbi:MAG: leucine-rich repeat domain-containing protein [Ruminococcaceae bacterium]|nr:leucine-rich repeat domain-containing protein [Oscillospiraceae bacterium]
MNKTMKKLLSITLAFIMLFGSVPMANLGIENLFAVKASAYYISGDYKYGLIMGGEVSIAKYIGTETDIVIPEKIDGYTVAAISDNAFKNQNIKSVIMPDTIEEIGESAFEGCEKLEYIKISPSVEFIREKAFTNCISLSDVDFGEINDNLRLIDEDVFAGCTSLKELTLPGSTIYDISTSTTFVYEDFIKGSGVETLNVKPRRISFQYKSLGSTDLREIYIDGYMTTFDEPFYERYKPDKIVFNTFLSDREELKKLFGYGYSYMRDDNGKIVLFASDEEQKEFVENGFRYIVGNNKAIIIDDHNGDKDIAFPETLGGYPVNEILVETYKGDKVVTSVTFPPSMEYIGVYAFGTAINLKTVNFNNGLKAIDACAFSDCGIENVVLPETVTYLSEYVFGGCESLKSVKAPGVTKIDHDAFYGCGSLENAEFSDRLYYIGRYAFEETTNLKKIETGTNEVAYLHDKAFYKSGISEFDFSDKLTSIPAYCFSNSEISEAVIPEGLESIGTGAFSDCKKLTKVEFSDSLKEVGERAFYGCELLDGTLYLDKNLVSVGKEAFSGTNFTELYYNIVDCEVLYDWDWDDYKLRAFENTCFEKIIIGNDVMVIPAGAFENQNKIESIVIPDSVEIIEEEAFRNCSSLENLSLPDSVTEIGHGAFKGCISLTEFTVPKSTKRLGYRPIPETVTTVYFNAENCEFYNINSDKDGGYLSIFVNKNINNVILGNTVKRIPDYFFSGYDYEKTLIIPDSVTEIGKYAFKNSSVKSLALPQNLISIEEGTFSGSDIELSDNSLPESLRMIGKSAFENCDYLTELYIPDSVLDIDESAFCDCDSLVKVRMSPNVKLIPESAFESCDSLTTFEWNSDVKLIGEYAFAEDMALADFDFVGVEKIYPNSFTGSGVNLVMLGENKKEEATELEVVEVSSFENCANLETLSIGGNVATIKSAAFANCGKLETAVISPTVTNIAVDAFDGCDALTIYCVEESYAHEYALNNGIPVSTFVIDAIPNQVYTGKEIEPDVNVKVSDKKLTENTDFAVKYSDNINVGTAKVLVSGKGIYKVLASVANFTIITKNVENITVSPVVNQIYDGSELKPEITVTNGDKILTEGVDYTVTYKNNTEAGTATAEITGIGNYSGKTTVTFEIVKQSFWQKVASFFEMIINAIVNFFRSIFK